jgi:hypothetical protein
MSNDELFEAELKAAYDKGLDEGLKHAKELATKGLWIGIFGIAAWIAAFFAVEILAHFFH